MNSAALNEKNDNNGLAMKPDGEIKDEMKVLAEESGIATGQHYLIVSRDTAAALGVGTIEDDGVSESAPKRLRVAGEDGQTYVFTVTAESSGDVSPDSKASEPIKLMQPSSSSSSSSSSSPSGQTSSCRMPMNPEAYVTQAWFTTRDDKTALQSKGHTWKQGQWTKDETELLQSNINDYCEEHNISDPTEIIFEMSKDERKDFYRTIALGLNRPLFSVYRRVIRMYDQKNHVGKYSQEEMQKLRELRTKHGTDWAAIGAVLGRSASSVKDKCRLMKDTCNSGKWLPEEERRLTEAVCELSGAQPGENITTGLSWAAVADRVGTRSEKQCRTKWLNYLNWKQQGGTEWTREDDINLILKMENSEATDETQIDWNELAKDWPSVRSPQWLRGKWWSLKRHVPDYQLLSFTGLVDYLKVIHLENVRLKNPLNNNLRVTRVDLPQSEVPAEMSVPIPVSIHSTVDAGENGEVGDRTLQTYEVLQQLAPNSSGAFLITQPQNNPAISLSGASVTTDHIIVHTLPVSQPSRTNSKDPENVTVQINPQPVIISTDNGSDTVISLTSSEIDGSVPLTDEISQSDSELQCLAQTDQISRDSCEMTHSDLETQHQMSGQSELIGGTDIDNEVSQSEIDSTSSDLVMVSSTSSHYVQSNTSDGELMHLPVHILTSDTADLIGSSSSDAEAEKNQGHDLTNEISETN